MTALARKLSIRASTITQSRIRVGGSLTLLFAFETKGRVLEELVASRWATTRLARAAELWRCCAAL